MYVDLCLGHFNSDGFGCTSQLVVPVHLNNITTPSSTLQGDWLKRICLQRMCTPTAAVGSASQTRSATAAGVAVNPVAQYVKLKKNTIKNSINHLACRWGGCMRPLILLLMVAGTTVEVVEGDSVWRGGEQGQSCTEVCKAVCRECSTAEETEMTQIRSVASLQVAADAANVECDGFDAFGDCASHTPFYIAGGACEHLRNPDAQCTGNGRATCANRKSSCLQYSIRWRTTRSKST